MLGKWTARLMPLVVFLFFSAGLSVLYHALSGHHFKEIAGHFSDFPKPVLCWAVLLTAFSYWVLSGYEWLGLRYIHKSLKYKNIFFSSLIANALGNNVGAVAFSGAAIRFRMYSSWGLSALENVKVIAFYHVTFSVGLVLILGIFFLRAPANALFFLPLNLQTTHALGLLFIVLVAGYILACQFSTKPFKFKIWQFQLPNLKIALSQLVFSLGDWMVAAGVLYVLLPDGHGMAYAVFLSFFIIGQVLGMISQVPGGLGVFEATLVAALSKTIPAEHLFVSLLYYRLIYYLLPLLISLICLSFIEFKNIKKSIIQAGNSTSQLLTIFAPPILSMTTFIAGGVLLFSGSTPAVGSRLAILNKFIPLPAIEFSHFLGSLAGVFLLFLARGIQRRLDAAYYLTLILLGFGMIFSMLKGFDYEESLILLTMLLLMIPCRQFFYRKASLFQEAFSPAWFLSVAMVISASICLGFFAFQHVDYSDHLWWKFGLQANASRFMRAGVGVTIFSIVLSLAHLLRSASIKIRPLSTADLLKAVPLILASKKTNALLALMGDKSFLFSEDGKAFIMYSIQGKSWVALGDPIGDEARWPDLVTGFRKLADQYSGIPAFYQIASDYLPLYLDAGFTLIKIGEEARVATHTFNLEGSVRKDFRNSHKRLEKEGVSFEMIRKENITQYLPELSSISGAWLRKKNTKEKGFSLGFFKEDYLRNFPMAMIKHKGAVTAFANVLLGAEKEEMSIDLMRYDPNKALPGTMDFLFVQLIFWGQKEGYRWFNLGMAPLAGLENRQFSPIWNKVGSFIFSKAEYFYNFEGLRDYKEKFGPVWRPKYIALPSGLSVPRVLSDISALNSGGFKGIFSK